MTLTNRSPLVVRRRLVAVAASTCLLVLTAACGLTTGDAGDGGTTQGVGGITRLTSAERGAPIDVGGVDLDGKPLSSKQWLGKVVVVNIWGSWCPPCRVEQPVLSQIATEMKPAGIEFLGVAIRESPETSKVFTTAKKVPYPSIGNGESAILAFADSLPAIAVPTTYIIDREGRVATRLLDRATYTTLKNLIDEVASEADDG
jgi:thiol-disulfide isomerase/thioredoxin